ncbi:hypothetical protein D9M72_532740 [compost metagenome]
MGFLARQHDGGEGELGYRYGVRVRAVGHQDAPVPQFLADKAPHRTGAVEHGAQLRHERQRVGIQAGNAPAGQEDFHPCQPLRELGVFNDIERIGPGLPAQVHEASKALQPR